MNQKKIGQFIAENRKKQKMTQAELAEKLGVSDRSVSKWETGRCMPDLSLFEPLCEQLGITINELLSGEKIKTEEYQNELEKNIINTIDYSQKQIEDEKWKRSYVVMIIGILFLTKFLDVAMTRFPHATYMIILGFVIGSIWDILKEMPAAPAGVEIPVCIALMAAGFLIIYLLSRTEDKYEKNSQ